MIAFLLFNYPLSFVKKMVQLTSRTISFDNFIKGNCNFHGIKIHTKP